MANIKQEEIVRPAAAIPALAIGAFAVGAVAFGALTVPVGLGSHGTAGVSPKTIRGIRTAKATSLSYGRYRGCR